MKKKDKKVRVVNKTKYSPNTGEPLVTCPYCGHESEFSQAYVQNYECACPECGTRFCVE